MKPTTPNQAKLAAFNASALQAMNQLPLDPAAQQDDAPTPTAAIDDSNIQSAGNALQSFQQIVSGQNALQNPGQFSGNPLAAYQQLPQGGQASLFGFNAPITQGFGNYNPGTEVFSHGFNSGTDFGVQPGTPIALPKGNWNVLQAFAGDSRPGYVGDGSNQGYGNSVLVHNADTGETLRFSHLSKVGVLPGQQVKGGTIALSGATGNVTGPHVDLEYYDKQGKLANVMQSAYAKYVMGKK